jgi:hypothetical protein
MEQWSVPTACADEVRAISLERGEIADRQSLEERSRFAQDERRDRERRR